MNHYIRLSEQNHIVKGFSDAFEEPLETDIIINAEGDRHFELNGVVNPSLFDDNQCPLYEYDNGILELTGEEKQAWLDAQPKPQKTELEIIKDAVDRLIIDSLGV